jgi:hypothetical protein
MRAKTEAELKLEQQIELVRKAKVLHHQLFFGARAVIMCQLLGLYLCGIDSKLDGSFGFEQEEQARKEREAAAAKAGTSHIKHMFISSLFSRFSSAMNILTRSDAVSN